jgi:16S rRNA A1518/A1519 N6-dimethyltransferase RsmA/KsgA/DIM1 with predicted DNA glycosylase/AP lyase activity
VAHVTAIELDADMVSALAPKIPANVTLIHADFLEFDLSRWPPIGRSGWLATCPTTCRRRFCSGA